MPRRRIRSGDELGEELVEAQDDLALRDEIIDKLTCQTGRLADLVREYLKNTRVRANAGFKPERCVACDVPHPAKLRACHCPHHKLIELLNELGYPAAEVTLYG